MCIFKCLHISREPCGFSAKYYSNSTKNSIELNGSCLILSFLKQILLKSSFASQTDSITTTVFCAILHVAYSPSSKVRILKSIPMVEINVGLNVLSANRNIIQVLPTPLSPIRSSLKNKSKFFCAAIL